MLKYIKIIKLLVRLSDNKLSYVIRSLKLHLIQFSTGNDHGPSIDHGPSTDHGPSDYGLCHPTGNDHGPNTDHSPSINHGLRTEKPFTEIHQLTY